MIIAFPILVSLVVFFIALQQFLLAKEKFKIDLFQKRFDVFKGAESFIYQLRFNKDFKHEVFYKFNIETQTASFIFDDDIQKFLYDLQGKGRDLKYLSDTIKPLEVGDERHKTFLKIESIQNELEGVETMLEHTFSPYLKFRKWHYGVILPKLILEIIEKMKA